jgi:hypothetical protein
MLCTTFSQVRFDRGGRLHKQLLREFDFDQSAGLGAMNCVATGDRNLMVARKFLF